MTKLYNKAIFSVALVAGLIAFSSNTYINNAIAAVGDGTASIKLLTPMSATETTPMDFGIFTTSASASSVVLDTSNSVSPTGTTQLGGSPASGVFNIVGDTGNTFSLAIADNGGSAGISLGSFTYNYNGGGEVSGPTASGLAALSGGANLVIGATMSIVGGTSGSLTRNYTVTVDYE